MSYEWALRRWQILWCISWLKFNWLKDRHKCNRKRCLETISFDNRRCRKKNPINQLHGRFRNSIFDQHPIIVFVTNSINSSLIERIVFSTLEFRMNMHFSGRIVLSKWTSVQFLSKVSIKHVFSLKISNRTHQPIPLKNEQNIISIYVYNR